MNDCPEIKERLSDSEIQRIKRESIDRADATKEKGNSRLVDESVDRQRALTRKTYFVTVPWNQD